MRTDNKTIFVMMFSVVIAGIILLSYIVFMAFKTGREIIFIDPDRLKTVYLKG